MGLDPQIIEIIRQPHHGKNQAASDDFLSAENILKLHVICETLHLQQITVDKLDEPGRLPILRLRVPVVAPT